MEEAVVIWMRIGIAEGGDAPDDQCVAVSIRIEPGDRSEAQQQGDQARGKTRLQRGRPVNPAPPVTQATGHAHHAGAGRLPEALDEEFYPKSPPDHWRDVHTRRQ